MTGAPAIVDPLQHPIDAATSRPTEVLLFFLRFVREEIEMSPAAC